MYAINPFRPVYQIVEDLHSRAAHDLTIQLGLSISRAVFEERPDALLALSLAYCIFSGQRLDGAALADMLEVMIECGPQKKGEGGQSSH